MSDMTLMTSHYITLDYAQLAREWDVKLRQRGLNWFHFATWGTYTVGRLMEHVGPEARKLLSEAEISVYDSVTCQEEGLAKAGFCCYEGAKGARPATAEALILHGTQMIAEAEQTLIDPLLNKALDLLDISQDPVLLSPHGLVKLPSPWGHFGTRFDWIMQYMQQHRNDQAFRRPFNAAQ